MTEYTNIGYEKSENEQLQYVNGIYSHPGAIPRDTRYIDNIRNQSLVK